MTDALPIRVRLARASDREPIVRFASHTFSGWDYLPNIWPHWIAATDGVLLVALPQVPVAGAPPYLDAEGAPLDPEVPVAVSRFAMLSEDEGWVEGIRVDPRVRGRSVATQLQIAELAWAAAHGARVVRYVTGDRNEASVRLGARHGFRLLVDWRAYRRRHEDEEDDAAWVADDLDPVRTLSEDAKEDAHRAQAYRRMAARGYAIAPAPDAVSSWWERVRSDPAFERGHRLYEHRAWAFQELTRERFERHVRGHQVAVREAPVGRWALALLPRHIAPSEDRRVRVSVLCGDAALAMDLISELEAVLQRRLQLRLPDPDPPILRGQQARIAALGLERAEGYLHLLERAADPGERLPTPLAPGLLELLEAPRRVALPLAIPEG